MTTKEYTSSECHQNTINSERHYIYREDVVELPCDECAFAK